MRRGDIWTVAGGRGFAGKPRPVVIVQDDAVAETASVTVCAFTTDETEAPLFRLPVEPNERNGLRVTCRLMVDKITTVPKSKVGAHIGAPRQRGHPVRQPGHSRLPRPRRIAEDSEGGVN
jgi:mRNA interferase MazF